MILFFGLGVSLWILASEWIVLTGRWPSVEISAWDAWRKGVTVGFCFTLAAAVAGWYQYARGPALAILLALVAWFGFATTRAIAEVTYALWVKRREKIVGKRLFAAITGVILGVVLVWVSKPWIGSGF